MFRSCLLAAGCFALAIGCNSSNQQPAPAAGTSSFSQPDQATQPSESSVESSGQESATHTSIQGPPTKAEMSLRELAARLVVSDGKGGWRIAEQPATELEKLGPQASADLLPLLKDTSAPVRRGAAFYLLGQFDPAQADQVAAFSALLDDDDQTLRGFGLTAVKQMREKDQIAALPRLTAMLTSMREDKAENRASIARLIGSLKEDASSAVDSLATAAADDPDAKVRAACLAALVQVAQPALCLLPLANGLSDADPAVRLVAAARLRLMGPVAAPAAKQLAAALGDSDARVGENAAEALIRIGAPAVEPAMAQLASQNIEAKKLALACLAKIGPDAKSALPAIEKCRSDADPVVRQLAEAAIKRITM
ncbi:MAG TPA: HEAT repeat domain-containing protein [Pirellulaceae bacterium]|nr:HEAT repeat domain-containing protein [Pirellulaceae bacterium]